jgi:hypothetical protein
MMSDSSERTIPPGIGYVSDPRKHRHSAPGLAGTSETVTVEMFVHQLRKALKDQPDAKIVVDGESVTVLRRSPDGPDVTAILSEGRCTLSIGAWHEDMESFDATLAYAKLAVEGDLRVRIDKIGRKPWQYALERRLEDNSWREESVVVFPRLNLLRRQKTTHYLRNAG